MQADEPSIKIIRSVRFGVKVQGILTVTAWLVLATILPRLTGFPSGASGKEPTCQCRRHEIQVGSLGWEDPLERTWQPTPVSLPGECHGQRSLTSYSPWGCKASHMTEQLTLHFTLLTLPKLAPSSSAHCSSISGTNLKKSFLTPYHLDLGRYLSSVLP